MTATESPPRRPTWGEVWNNPSFRLTVRWALIGVLTLIAFHSTLANLIEVTRVGAIGSYVWTVPLAGILAAIAIAHRDRTELPIHDRQSDLILGTMGLVFALLLHGVLLQRYALYFYLLRLDLVAMWLFVMSCAVVLFGLRPVFRFARVWALMFMVFPLPYYIAVVLLGGNQMAAGFTTLMISGTATGIAVGRTRKRGYVGAFSAWGVGIMMLLAMRFLFPNAPFIAYVQIPALTSIVVVGLLLYFHARRGQSKWVLRREVQPLAAKQAWAGLPLVVIIAITLSFVKLPSPGIPPPTQFDYMRFGAALEPPSGWHTADVESYRWVERLHGPGANLIRQTMVADVGNAEWDKHSRPRTVVVDTLTTYRPFSLKVYPSKVLYSVQRSRLSKPHSVQLGKGITGQIVSVVDDDLLVTWNMMQWSWRNEFSAQRVLVIAVDNHDVNAPFPKPAGALIPTLDTLFTVLFRGNAAVTDREPEFKDAEMLTTFSRALVIDRVGRQS